jgi:hypothetical protein
MEPLLIGNDKTGKSIWQFSLPAVTTCHGLTADCYSACYARKGHFTTFNPQRRFAMNDAMRMQPDFADRVIGQIAAGRIQTVRVHVSGDFDSPEYIAKWQRIAESRKRTQFFAYTRAWAVDRLAPALEQLAALPNFQLWLSADRSGKTPPAMPGARIAYMAADDDDIADHKVDMVFRVKRTTRQTRIGGIMVCPTERESNKGNVKCESCRLCFDKTERIDTFNRRVLPVLIG